MNKISYVVTFVLVSSQLIFTLPSYAVPAPVYDADSLAQPLDEMAMENTQDLPPPPPPTQDAAYPAMQPQNDANPILPRPQALGIEQRVRRVEQQINNMQNNNANNQVESLQGQVQALRGQLEQLNHQLEELQKQQKNIYSDLDKRLAQQATNKRLDPQPLSDSPYSASSAKGTQISAKSVAKPVDQNGINAAEEQKIYQVAYNYIKAKKYNEAVTTLQGMLKKYPSGQFAANAHYWLGELFGLLGKHDQALTEFAAVVADFPDSPRVSDAQLKVGLIYAAQSKYSEAKLALRKVVNRYPATASARLAKEQLKQINDTGH